MIKKYILVSLLALSPYLFAGDDITLKGSITAVNPAQRTLSIVSQRGVASVQVLPNTKLKGDDCGMFGNNFFTIGRLVEIEAKATLGAYPNTMQVPAQGAQPLLVAEEISWKCIPQAF